jgi:hypothetical protein
MPKYINCSSGSSEFMSTVVKMHRRNVVFLLSVFFATTLLSGQAMKIERSGYEREINTKLMVAALVTNPNIHYLLTCAPDRNDCEVLLAGERYDFTPVPDRVYSTGPNLATYEDGKRIVVLVQRIALR